MKTKGDLLKKTVLGAAMLGAMAAGVSVFGAWRWKRATQALVEHLNEGGAKAANLRYNADSIAGLPCPVQRYFRTVLTDGQPIVQSADIRMDGVFNLSLDRPRWRPFTSRQRVVIDRPGFVWDARVMVLPGVPVFVHDAYVAGMGILRPTIFGLVPLGAIKGTGDIARGELMRWLAEAVWYPTALLPGHGLEWTAVDSTTALATMTDGPVTLSMLFRFGTDGLISGIHVSARGAQVNRTTVMIPWQGRFHDYRRVNGMMIPFQGEVSWITPQGERPYFRGTISQVTHNVS